MDLAISSLIKGHFDRTRWDIFFERELGVRDQEVVVDQSDDIESHLLGHR